MKLNNTRIWKSIMDLTKLGLSCIYLALTWSTRLTESLECLSCKAVADPSDCASMEHCGHNSNCYLDQLLLTDQGSIRYNLGCRETMHCNTIRGGRSVNTSSVSSTKEEGPSRSRSQRGTKLLCTECCTGTLCNNVGCNTAGFPKPHGPICYNCTQSRSPDSCDHIKVCRSDEDCHIWQYTNGPDLLHGMGCYSKTKCLNDRLSTLVGRSTNMQRHLPETGTRKRTNRGPALAEHCCANSLCNYALPNKQSTSPGPSHWGQWSPWSLCSPTCGSGVKIRDRKCLVTGTGAGCVGNRNEAELCQQVACVHARPVDGAWSTWGPWSQCDNTKYTIGTMTRVRTCTNPLPGPGGKPCLHSPDFIDIDRKYCKGSQSPHCTGTVISKIWFEGSWKIGGYVILHCSATGNPDPDIQWKAHTELNVIRSKNDTSTLVIANINTSHAGNFTCEAWNNCGHVAREIYTASVH